MLNNTCEGEPQPTPPRKRRRADLAYHRIKCTICRHPHRDAIEHAYLHWHSPARIAREYDMFNPSAIYRHARALRLDAKRRRNAINSLEFIIEHAASIVPTAKEVINAVRACCRLNQQGQWIDPPKRREVIHVDEQGNRLPSRTNHAANSAAQTKTPHVTNVTSAKSAQNQSPTPPIRNWFISLKTKATRLIQSPTFRHFSKSKKSPSAPPHTATVRPREIAAAQRSMLSDPCPSAVLPLNEVLACSIPGSLRVCVPLWQNSDPVPASVDVHVAHLLL